MRIKKRRNTFSRNTYGRNTVSIRRDGRNKITLALFVLLIIVFILVITIIARSCSASIKNKASDSEGKNSTTTTTEKKGNVTEAKDLYYYDSSRAKRYDAYAKDNPDIDLGDVVWMVNVDMDNPEYEEVIEADDYDSTTVLVNKHYYVPEGYTPSNLVKVDSAEIRSDAADAYKKMKKAAAKKKYTIGALSGYRDYETQDSVYNRYLEAGDEEEIVDTYSARPGYSEHHTGLAIDISNSSLELSEFEGTPEAQWVEENCYKYGFILRYTEENSQYTGYITEPWHIRFIGVKHATKMRELKILSYEEYKVKYIDYSPDGDK